MTVCQHLGLGFHASDGEGPEEYLGCDSRSSGTVPRRQFCTTVPATTPHKILWEEAFMVWVTPEVPLWSQMAGKHRSSSPIGLSSPRERIRSSPEL